MGISDNDLIELLRNYSRLEQAAAGMFQGWASMDEDTQTKSTLAEFAEIEKSQALALMSHLRELGGELGTAPTTLEPAIVAYLKQIDRLPSLGERLRFNYMVMTTLERPVIMRALLSANPATLELFTSILNNEDRILSWCDRTATSLGYETLDLNKYYEPEQGTAERLAS